MSFLRLCLALLVLRMQMSMSTAIKHKHNVMSIAERGVAHGRKEFLGVLYDELARWADLWGSTHARATSYVFVHCRTEWEDMSGKMSRLFKIDECAAVICNTLERRAEILHDKLFGPPKLQADKANGSGGKGEKKPKNTANNASGAQGKGLICGHCGKPGHASISCYKWKAMWSWNDSENKGKNAKGKGKGDKGKVFECCLFLWRVSILHMPIQGKRNANAGGAAADAPAGKKRKFACFNCGKEDHKAADCPEPKKEQA